MTRRHRRPFSTYVTRFIVIGLIISVPSIFYLVYGDLNAPFETWIKALTIVAGFWLLLVVMTTSLLALRIPWVDEKVGGLSEALLHHKILGIVSIFFLGLHWCLAGIGGAFLKPPVHTYANEFILDETPAEFLISMWDFFRGMGLWLGIIMIALLFLSLFGKFMRQTAWLQWHRIFGIIVFLGSLHGVFAIPRAFQGSWVMVLAFLLAFGCVALLVIQFILDLDSSEQGKVLRAISVGNHTLRIWLRTLTGEPIMPGQFVCVSFDKREHPHPFSVVDSQVSPDGTNLSIMVKDSGKYTHELQTRALDGENSYVQGPYGMFLSEADPSKYQVWIAGGVGITPFLSAMQEKVKIPTTLIWSMRGPSKEYLDLVVERARRAGITLYLIDSSKGQHLNRNVSLLNLIPDPHTVQVWFCGPPPMREGIANALKPYKVKVHYEHFNWR